MLTSCNFTLEQSWEVRGAATPIVERPLNLPSGDLDPRELQAQIRQMQSLIRSQQRQILEHQEALAEMHNLISGQVPTDGLGPQNTAIWN